MSALPVRGMAVNVSFDERNCECTNVLLKYAQVLSIEIIRSKDCAKLLAANLATTLDSETHTLISAEVIFNLENGDGFLPPKSSPIIVNNEADVDGINFNDTRDDFGAMNDDRFAKLYDIKPKNSCARCPIVIAIAEDPGNEGGERHFRTESDIHT